MIGKRFKLWFALTLTVGVAASVAAITRSRPKQLPAQPPPVFVDQARARGLTFELGHGKKSPLDIRETLGTGAALWDYDRDGWLDAFLVGQQGTRPDGAGALFRNRGDGTFEDASGGSGLDVPGPWHGCAVGDVNNDGYPDLLLTGMGECRLFRNLQGRSFQDVTAASGLRARSPLEWNTSAAFADVNRDGLLDLFVGRYVRYGPNDLRLCNHFGVMAACGPRSYEPQTGSLYLQNKGGTFRDATAEFGLGDQNGKTLGVAFADCNADGFPDFYLANDEVPGDLYLNLQGRRFRNLGAESGTAFNGAGQVQGGMGLDWGDYDRDGQWDLFVATFQNEPKSLYRRVTGTTFEETGTLAGLAHVTRPFVAFGARFLDYDHDGFEDLLTVNGHMKDNIAHIDTSTSYRQRSQLLRNIQGQRFVEIRGSATHALERPIVGRGLAVGDVDQDGDLDALITDLEGPTLLLMNQAARGNWLSVELVGSSSNRMALGAVVRAQADGRTLLRQCQTAGSYLSSGAARVHFGLGSDPNVDLEIRWPSGQVTRRVGVRANQRLRVVEAR